MFQIKAKYNFANVMLPDESYIDDETKKQIYGFLNHPAFGNSYIAIMPDCHAGAGSCIGFTMKLNEYIIPNIVGVDLGCGVLSVNLGQKNIELDKLDEFIHKNIPHGFNVNEKMDSCIYKDKSFTNRVVEISKKIDSDADRNLKALGSLGGGNHFLEIGVDETGDKWLTVHSGSRKFGLDVAVYHQNRAKKLMEKMFIGSAYNKLEFLPIEAEGKEYLNDAIVAQRFAEMNRIIMMTNILQYLGMRMTIDTKEVVHSVHNYINFNDNIIRKGAISANKDEQLVIPFNMEDGLIIGRGKGNSKWNNSAPHGAGRVLSRRKAKESLNLQKAQENMSKAGIYTTSLSDKTLDEVKDAYKDKDMILKAIEETVTVDHFVKPIYNFKAEE